MDYFPAFIDVAGQPCLVVGGNEAAANKVQLLLRANAKVTVVALALNTALRRLACERAIAHHERAFRPVDVVGQRLVISAAEDAASNEAVSAAAHNAGVLVNVVDQPSLCSFVVPALIDRNPMIVAISTGGTAPVLARMVRARIESLLPAGLGRMAAFTNSFRVRVKRAITNPVRRRRFWERVLEGPVAGLMYAGNERAARRAMLDDITASQSDTPLTGEIALVDSRPEAVDLLTFGALRAMQCADVVVHDRRAAAEVLDLMRRDAERVVLDGAQPVTTPNGICLSLAQRGRRVLRLLDGRHECLITTARHLETVSGGRIPIGIYACTAADVGRHIPAMATTCSKYTNSDGDHRAE